MKTSIVVVDVGPENAGFGGPYTACRRLLNNAFGKTHVKGGYGRGFDMDQGIFVRDVSVTKVRKALGERYNWVSVKKAEATTLWLAKGAFGIKRSPLSFR